MRVAITFAVAIACLLALNPATYAEDRPKQTNRGLYHEAGRIWRVEHVTLFPKKKERKKAVKEWTEGKQVELDDFKSSVLSKEEIEVESATDRQANVIRRYYDKDGKLERDDPASPLALDGMVYPELPNGAEEVNTETLEIGDTEFDCQVWKWEKWGSTHVAWIPRLCQGLRLLEFTWDDRSESVSMSRVYEVENFTLKDPDEKEEPDAKPGEKDAKEDEKPEPEVKAPKYSKPAEDDWVLFKKQGRIWMNCTEYLYDGKVLSKTYTRYEVLSVKKDSCKLKTQALDKNKKAMTDGNTQELKFNKDNELWIKPMDNAKEVGEERIEAAGEEFTCIVYEDTKTLRGKTMKYWFAKSFPGLIVKQTTTDEEGNITSQMSLEEFVE